MTNNQRQIWLIGGTVESGEIANAIAAEKISCIVSVTTESAKGLYPQTPELKIRVGRLKGDRIGDFLQREGIIGILDASHPFAVEISQMAIAASQTYNLPYLRYERPQITSSYDPLYLSSFETLIEGNYLMGERVLLTVGYRPLERFKDWHERATLYARILPSLTALEVALCAGFRNDRIVALRPPISAELETALWQQWKISTVVTKASGTAGGEETKQKVAKNLGVRSIVIARPEIDYPLQTSELEKAIAFVRRIWMSPLD